MLAPSMMGSRIGRDSTLACETAPCPSRRSSALAFVTTPDNRLRYKRDNSSLWTEGRCRHLLHPRRLRKAVAQRAARLMTTLMRTIESVMDSNSKANRGRSQSFNPLLRFPEVWNPTLSCVRAGFRNQLYEGNDHTAEAPTHDNAERTGQLLDCRLFGSYRWTRRLGPGKSDYRKRGNRGIGTCPVSA